MKAAKCPRWGFIKLTTRIGRSYVTQTVCKTWGCPVCWKKVIALVRMKMEIGCLRLGLCYLITVTFGWDTGLARDADSVHKAWTRFLRLLRKRSSNQEIAWFKIIELTRKGMPHLHLLVGGLSKRNASCVKQGRKVPYSVKWINAYCEKDCLIHEWGKSWLWATGDSFVVDAKEVYNPGGAAGYLTKYLVKGMVNHEELAELGFGRRYSSSRNWPRAEAIRLAGSQKGWESVEIVPRWFRRNEMEELENYSRGKEAMVRIGDDLALVLTGAKKKKVFRKKLEAMKG